MELAEVLRIKLKLAANMLKPCACPMCDGGGIVGYHEHEVEGKKYVEAELCEWCYTRDELIKDYAD